MTNIDGFAAAEEVVGPITWNDLRVIRRLCWQLVQPGDHSVCELVICSEGSQPYELTLICERIRDLRVEDLEDPRMTGFDVVSMADQQWERVNWEVGDFEENKMRFYCQTVRIESARRLITPR